MRILCLFVHFFDSNGTFAGKSKYQDPAVRAEVVNRCLLSLKSLKFIEARVCGYSEKTLIPLDVDLSKMVSNPQLLVYEALCTIAKCSEEFDYYMVIEDDILVSPDIFYNVFDFDSEFDAIRDGRWIFHPNRVELTNNILECIDIKVIKRRVGTPIRFKGRELWQYENPHSGILIVNRKKLNIIREEVDLSFRGQVIGGPMASAFAHFHRPFLLYRVADGYDMHAVRHLDPMHYEPLTPMQRLTRKLDRVFQRKVLG